MMLDNSKARHQAEIVEQPRRRERSLVEPLEFRLERFATVARELPALFLAHWDEISYYKKLGVPLKPEWDNFFALDRSNMLMGFTARSEGLLVGYMGFIVGKNLQHGYKTADCNAIYLTPEFRSGWNGIKFIRFAEQILKEEGYKFINIEYTEDFNLGPLLKRLGYSPAFKTSVKHLGD